MPAVSSWPAFAVVVFGAAVAAMQAGFDGALGLQGVWLVTAVAESRSVRIETQGGQAMTTLKVLYIAGSGRSGSTILGNLLGQIDGFVHVGELYFIWSHGLIHNHLCGCGQPVRECAMWQAVFDDAYGGLERIDPRQMIAGHQTHTGGRYQLPLFARAGRPPSEAAKEYLVRLRALYAGLLRVNQARVIVDSSKIHSQLLALSQMPDVELHMLHLVRDPRGVAHSWQKKKRSLGTGDRAYMDRYNAGRSALKWNMRNVYVSLVARQPTVQGQFLRYEDFVAEPRASLIRILADVNETADLSFLIGDREAEMQVVQHAIHGNPVRFQTNKRVILQSDDAWIANLSTKDKLITVLATLPLLKKYGYSASLNRAR